MTGQGRLKAPHPQEVPRIAPDRSSSPKGHVARRARVPAACGSLPDHAKATRGGPHGPALMAPSRQGRRDRFARGLGGWPGQGDAKGVEGARGSCDKPLWQPRRMESAGWPSPYDWLGMGSLGRGSVSSTRRSPSLAGFYAGWGASCGGPVPRGGCGGKAQPHAAQGVPGCPSERPFGFSRRPRQPIRGDAGLTRIMDPSSEGPIATQMPSLRSISLAARFPASHARPGSVSSDRERSISMALGSG